MRLVFFQGLGVDDARARLKLSYKKFNPLFENAITKLRANLGLPQFTPGERKQFFYARYWEKPLHSTVPTYEIRGHAKKNACSSRQAWWVAHSQTYPTMLWAN